MAGRDTRLARSVAQAPQRLRHPLLGGCARTTPLGELLGQPLAVGLPLGQARRW
jgi:hypothetical protein